MKKVFLVLALALPLAADEVHLKNGHKIEGVVREEGGKVIVQLDAGTVTLDRGQVARIVRAVSSLEEFAAKLKEVKAGDVEGYFKLGIWAKERDLHHKAKQMFERILNINPDHEEARKALGYTKHDGKWMTEDEIMVALGFVRHEGKWLKRETVEKILEQENLLERERVANATREKIAELEAEIRRIEIAAQEERDRLMADVAKSVQPRILVSPVAHFHGVGGAVRPCHCANIKKKF